MVKMRLRQEWHMRWVQDSLAVFEMRTSLPQVRQETFFSGVGGALARKMLDRRDGCFLALDVEVMELATVTDEGVF